MSSLVAFLTVILVFAPVSLQAQGQEPAPPMPPPPAQEDPYAMKVDVPMTILDLVFTNKRGDILGIKFDNLEAAQSAIEVYEDGNPQKLEFFEPSEAPLTTVLLVEATPFVGYYMRYENLITASIFAEQMRRNDWVALVGYDMRPRLEVDFTHDSNEIYAGLSRMQYGGFSEANMYDAVLDTLERLKDVKGKTSIIVVGTGIDTFSKVTWDDARKQARNYRTTIFCIGTAWPLILMADRISGNSRYSRNYQRKADELRMMIQVAEAQMRELSTKSGGWAHFPRFITELPDVYKLIAGGLRQQHTIGYYPTNRDLNGKTRKIEVRLSNAFEDNLRRRSDLNGDGVIDKKDLKEKIIIVHKQEYTPGKVE